MSFSISKIGGKLIFKDLGGYETRNPSTFWCIQKADEIYEWDDFSEIKIYTGDFENDINNYSYSKQNSYINLVPDFNFHSWEQVGINDYENFVKDIDISGLTNYEIHKVGWIGSINTNFRRKQMLEIANDNNELFDIFDCGNWVRISNNVQLKSNKYIFTPELVKNIAY